MKTPEKLASLFEGPPTDKYEKKLRPGHRPLHRGPYRGDHRQHTKAYHERTIPPNLGFARKAHRIHERATRPRLKPEEKKEIPDQPKHPKGSPTIADILPQEVKDKLKE